MYQGQSVTFSWPHTPLTELQLDDISHEKKDIQTNAYDESKSYCLAAYCLPGGSSGGIIFGSILATYLPKYKALLKTTDPGSTVTDENVEWDRTFWRKELALAVYRTEEEAYWFEDGLLYKVHQRSALSVEESSWAGFLLNNMVFKRKNTWKQMDMLLVNGLK